MGRRIRWTVLALVVVVVTGIVILVITVRPGLQDDAQEVRRTWRPLLQPLAARYVTLNGVVGALEDVGNGDRDATRELRRTLTDWDLLRPTTDAAAQARTANDLEALAARIRAIVQGSDRLKGNQGLLDSLAAFDETRVPPRSVERYNDAVLAYEHNRSGMLRRIVATLDGYDEHPTLQLTRPPDQG
jgi:hypothetical protein